MEHLCKLYFASSNYLQLMDTWEALFSNLVIFQRLWSTLKNNLRYLRYFFEIGKADNKQETKDRAMEGKYYHNLGRIQHQLGDFKKAIGSYQRARILLKVWIFFLLKLTPGRYPVIQKLNNQQQ